MAKFEPTDEQIAIVELEGSAFISACPGAGKTRCIVERARVVLSNPQNVGGLAFLSFTNAAVIELQERLTKERLLPVPAFPHFIGTFDSFIWHYLVEPFGLNGNNNPLKIIPDSGRLTVMPYPGAQALRLDCFDRATGNIIPEKAVKAGFKRDPARYETIARNMRARLLENGQLDFEDVRRTANSNLEDEAFSRRLGCILSARFGEIIVDEAQDCNPDDLSIIDWLRASANIPTKVVCDPNQSIYEFRGGVSDELFDYADTFSKSEQLSLTGNFRSSQNICKVVQSLRAPSQRGEVDEALGELKDCGVSIHVLSYRGRGVSMQIGTAFTSLVAENEIDLKDCRLTAKTRNSGLKAVGAYINNVGLSLSLRLADAVMKFHHAENSKDQLSAIIDTHLITMIISGKLGDRTYHQVITEDGLDTLSWRGQIVQILCSLRFDVTAGHTRQDWIARARNTLSPFLPAGQGSIAQKLPNQTKLDDILGLSPVPGLGVRTIHEVKGKQYQGMCVVLTTASAKGILTHLEDEPDDSRAEEARELYVAASRAQRLLVFACPQSQSQRLVRQISSNGAAVQVTEI